MASRNRLSTANPTSSRPSGTAASQRAPTDDLPPYRKPSHPLDADATRSLRDLQGGRHLNDIKRHNQQAIQIIKDSAETVNDMLRDHAQYIERRQKKWDAGKNLEDKEQEEENMRLLQDRVDEATAKLEESMRAVIDSGMAAQRVDESLDWLREHGPRQLETEYQTQTQVRATQRESQLQSQSQSQQRRGQDGNEATAMMDDAPTPGPTPLEIPRVALTGTSEIFKERMEKEKDKYTALSYTARYARNNNYRDFKRLVHDAKYGDEGPPLGHEDTWFTETGSPAPGITSTQRGDFDDDDDIVMDKATISTRCPITFQQFKEPYTSVKCPHTFEKNAILGMIRASRTMGHHGKPAIECPVAGCDQVRLHALSLLAIFTAEEDDTSQHH